VPPSPTRTSCGDTRRRRSAGSPPAPRPPAVPRLPPPGTHLELDLGLSLRGHRGDPAGRERAARAPYKGRAAPWRRAARAGRRRDGDGPRAPGRRGPEDGGGWTGAGDGRMATSDDRGPQAPHPDPARCRRRVFTTAALPPPPPRPLRPTPPVLPPRSPNPRRPRPARPAPPLPSRSVSAPVRLRLERWRKRDSNAGDAADAGAREAGPRGAGQRRRAQPRGARTHVRARARAARDQAAASADLRLDSRGRCGGSRGEGGGRGSGGTERERARTLSRGTSWACSEGGLTARMRRPQVARPAPASHAGGGHAE
jgi:hypothetical protein